MWEEEFNRGSRRDGKAARYRVEFRMGAVDAAGRPGAVAHAPMNPFDSLSRPLDVVLGGPVSSYARLAAAGRLVPLDGPGRPLWCVSRRRRSCRSPAPP